MAANALAIVGLIRNAQGIRGEVVIEPLTDAPDAVFASGRRVFVGGPGGKSDGDETPMTIESATAIVPWRPKKASSAISLLRADIPIEASGWLCRNLALGDGGRGFSRREHTHGAR